MLGKECNRCLTVTDTDTISPIPVLRDSCRYFFVIERVPKKCVNSSAIATIVQGLITRKSLNMAAKRMYEKTCR